jgi:hypothetical protein
MDSRVHTSRKARLQYILSAVWTKRKSDYESALFLSQSNCVLQRVAVGRVQSVDWPDFMVE